MSEPGRDVAFDARPLAEPVDRGEVATFAQHLKQTGQAPSILGSANTVIPLIVFGVVALIFASVAISMFATMISVTARSGSFGVALPALIPFLVISIGAGVAITAMVRGRFRTRERWYRLHRFAGANGMEYLPHLRAPHLPGMIFGRGNDRHSTDLVRGHQPRFVEFANYRYSTGSGKNRTTHKWGYVAVKLDVPLPHIILDAKGNNGLFGASNLPRALDADQRLSLEGDFDQHFSLYCPAGYERDALYLFTPDIMARFIDNAAQLDVEIVDDWLFFYAKRDLSTLHPATWAWLFSVVGAVLDKLAQWARWRDERLSPAMDGAHSGVPHVSAESAPLRPPPGVAAEGQRLKGGIRWGSIIAIGGFALVWVLMQVISRF